MKKTSIILFISILVVSGLIFGLTYFKGNKTSIVSNINSSVESQVKDIEWGSYTSNDITLDGKSIEITESGVYTISGTITNGLIKINTSENVKLILNGVSITNESGPVIYVENADNLEISTVSGTTNTLTDGSTYTGYEEDVNACIYSKDDLILSGEGTLKVVANYNDGIASKDDLKITGGTYTVESKDDGIRGKDSVEITGGNFTITSGGDAIKSTNDTDAGKGFIMISGGTFKIYATNDAVQAETELVISGGNFDITSGGGSKGTSAKTGFGMNNSNKSSDTESTKGLKANTLIKITGGTFKINSLDDGIHSNGNISITNGEFTISSDDDGIHADGLIEINGGIFTITSAEGIEATYVKINDGTIKISASDDGINAGNKSKDYQVTIEINGGNITIDMGQGDTDAIDSNGNLYINGGTLTITAQSPFDYDGEAKYTGGTMIVNGTKTTQITNQMMGGGGMRGGMQNGNSEPPQDGNNGQNRRGGMNRNK